MNENAVEREIFSSYFSQELFDSEKEFLTDYYLMDWETEDDISDEEVFGLYYDDLADEWNEEKWYLDRFFSGKTLVVRGTVQDLNGVHKVERVFSSLDDMLKLCSRCDAMRLYDVEGHFFVHSSHREGERQFEVKELTKKAAGYVTDNHLLKGAPLPAELFDNVQYSRLPHYLYHAHGYGQTGNIGKDSCA